MNSWKKIINMYMPIHTKRKRKRLKKEQRTTKNNRQTSNTVLAFTSAFAWCE